MRASILNLSYDSQLGGFDDRELRRALAGGEPVTIEARFFETDDVPRLCCLLVWRDGDYGKGERRSGEHRSGERRSGERRSGEHRDVHNATRRPRNGHAPEAAQKPAGAELEASGAARTRRRSVDPAPLELAPDERRAFDALRAWRRARSIELGVPAFRVLTDRQLATVARAKPLDAPALATLEGIGDKRAQRCGDSLFKTLRDAEPSELGAGALRTG